MKPIVSFREAATSPALLGPILGGPSWLGWRALLLAALGEELEPEERAEFERLTGRPNEPLEKVDEFWSIVGRRGGKSRAISCLAIYLALLCDYSDCLAVGERGVLLILAQNQKQAGIVFNYISGILESIPALAKLVTNKTSEIISLANGIDIEIRAASFRGVRGITAIAVICDEIGHWQADDTSRNPDAEILAAVRPALASTNGILCAIGTPFARRGQMWETYKRDFGKDGDPLILIAKGASRDLNPTLPQRIVDREMKKDEAYAKAEYYAEFRTDLEQFLAAEVVDGAVEPGRYELPPLSSIAYYGFVDPSGGSSDSMTLATAHLEGETVILDLIREIQPPFSPDSVVTDFCDTLKRYHLNEVTGDRWGGEFVREQFESRGITYNVSELPKSDIYKEFLPLINSGRVELLDKPRLTSQLVGLERRTARGGRDSIDHSPGNHDDVANAAAGSIVLASGLSSPDEFDLDEYMRAFGPESTSAQQLLGRVF